MMTKHSVPAAKNANKNAPMTSDLGNAHVIDWYLWREMQHMLPRLAQGLRTPKRKWFTLIPADRFDPEDWTRYDGELL